jgi:hypothetical protein
MRNVRSLAFLLLVAACGTASAADALPANWDGLVQVKAKRMDAVYLLPGADFRPYTKLKIDPTEAAFQKDWIRSQNNSRNLSRQVTPEHAEKILAAARTNFDDIIAEAYTKAGYEVVSSPGPDVLRVSAAVVNLYVNAPDVMSAGRSYSFTTEAGEATLVMEVRDSMTGTLLGRVFDRRETRRAGGMRMTTSVSNEQEFRALFKQWAAIAVKGLAELKEQSPVPEDLESGK